LLFGAFGFVSKFVFWISNFLGQSDSKRGKGMKRSPFHGAGRWAIGIDLGGTKTLVAQVSDEGKILRQRLFPTHASTGPDGVKKNLVAAVKGLMEKTDGHAAGVGVGVAGQVDEDRGSVRFAPNLGWREEPFREDLEKELGLPVWVTNDVRAATRGEWLYGAGRGCNDLICLFVGTGIGGGVVSGGRVLTGCSNTAGELGHITVDLNGPSCRCGNRGCLEALAGGWAIAQQAREWVTSDPEAGALVLGMVDGQTEKITAKVMADAAKAADPLALSLFERVALALAAGAASLVNAFNPGRLIFGGGVIEGYPWLVKKVAEGLEDRALPPALAPLRILRARLRNHAAAVGSAALVLHCSEKG
jgi:glucokinase